MSEIGHRSLATQRILHDRPHYSKQYPYKRFIEQIVPKIRTIEARSVGMEFFYVFVNHERRDYFDIWMRTNTLIPHLQSYAEKAGISFETLFTYVYVYTHSSDAYTEVIKPLLDQGYTDLAGDMKRNMNVVLKKGERKAETYRLGLLDVLSNPVRHEELMRPRESAKKAVATLRSPRTAARTAAATAQQHGNNNAAATIGRIAKQEAQQNRARTARSVRNTIRKTVRNTPRLPQNITRNIYTYLRGPLSDEKRRQVSRTANVRPMDLDKLFGE